LNFTEALELSYAKHGGNNLPWEISKDAYLLIFQQGWHAHAEAIKQTDLFPGTWDKDPISANEAAKELHPPCKRESVGSTPTVGSIDTRCVTAEDIYEAYPRKIGRGAAIRAITKAIKNLKKPLPETPGDGIPWDGAIDWREFWILSRTKAYASAVSKWPADERKFCPHPATFFNQERYLDDPKEWSRGQATSQFSKTY
jgi:hypothetical protein